jgi:hypothetical protein
MVSMLPWRVSKVKDLSSAQLHSLRVHMNDSPETLKETITELGPNTRIGIVQIPIQVMMLRVMMDPPRLRSFKTFEEYHAFFKKKEPVPRHSKRWSIILSGQEWANEAIIDGWHRFHSYVRSGFKSVPALWYAAE